MKEKVYKLLYMRLTLGTKYKNSILNVKILY